MLISCYNPQELGDVLMVVTGQTRGKQRVTQHGNVVRISDAKTDATLGYNFWHARNVVSGLTGRGQVQLTVTQVEELNRALAAVDFEANLAVDDTPKFVVGYVEEMKAHPDSDHLHVTETRVDDGNVLQIVCGAPNIAAGQIVVVAKVGAMMPNGVIIWPGKLRGVASDGMICSARELALPNAPQKRGILELPADQFTAGEPFDFKKGAMVLKAQA
ncbi:YtpR family tRNA-binding protein [Ligilactobacillus sp. LYQ139]|uniref:YtpR family tRNA-binding protein n=1 Tax=Ligilactobacillus sp. LYQ139 TaxID=3378800 RepID=UPI003852B868